MHAPLFTLAKAAAKAPHCQVIHSLSTGYAGFLATLIKQQRPQVYLLLSEHGIYTKERKIELAQAQWIEDRTIPSYTGLDHSTGYIRNLWVHFFEFLGKATYDAADHITCLYGGNRQRQIAEGAPAEKITIIPNGIAEGRFQDALRRRPHVIPHVIGLAGRIVPIKDVKTFIRAIDIARHSTPDVEGWIIGPLEEDPDYVQECVNLVTQLQLGHHIRFCGFQSLPDIFHQLGVLVLTSISEALPLVVLEGFAAGIPSVCTDVGGCRELVLGGSHPEDQAIGAAGDIVGIADPRAVADACTRLLTDSERWYTAQAAALARVHRWYTDGQMFARYHELYQQGMERHAVQALSVPASACQERC
ncbi:GT4 family glycosyltransferase PelF [Endozoicomonas sp. SCSIO W0465]|nr:GT4 family glycosyltransferase PelF [Endozoicomonas sp. SCSIO W0465]